MVLLVRLILIGAAVLFIGQAAFARAADAAAPADSVWLSTLDLGKVQQDFGRPQADRSTQGNPLSINGQKFDHGLGTHAESLLVVDLAGAANRLTAQVGIDDEVQRPSNPVMFQLIGDGKTLWQSKPLVNGQPAEPVDVDLSGVKLLKLKVVPAGDGINGAHADWADPKITFIGHPPVAIDPPMPAPVILTPPAPPTPRINGPRVFGVRPGRPFLYTIPATGDRPMTFAATNLPPGLLIDAATGQITGSVANAGDFPVTLHATNARGTADLKFRIVVGDKIALTPPMGWNSWNCWAWTVDQDKVLRSAKAMVTSGLINHGWTYINIDDTWQGTHGGDFHGLQGNERFPDMKSLCDQIHSMGLKAGIYSTPWMGSYAMFPGGSASNPEGTWVRPPPEKRFPEPNPDHTFGKYSFATADAKQWAQWGFDYLKYDWNPNDVPHVKEMSDALQASGRDVVFSLSNDAPFDQAADWAALANVWRTTGDIVDTWSRVRTIGFSQDKWAPFNGPGHFNDPDMLVVGRVGWGNPHPTKLTPDEQYTHISLWCLLSAPMLIGCDMEKLDAFTLSLLSNDEVLAIDQDPLCKQATCVARPGQIRIYAKDLEDGSKAVGLFNLGDDPATATANFADLKLAAKQTVRDLWRQQDLGVQDGKFDAIVPSHGVVLIKLTPAP